MKKYRAGDAVCFINPDMSSVISGMVYSISGHKIEVLHFHILYSDGTSESYKGRIIVDVSRCYPNPKKAFAKINKINQKRGAELLYEIRNVNDLFLFPVNHDITQDTIARQAYLIRGKHLLGMDLSGEPEKGDMHHARL